VKPPLKKDGKETLHSDIAHWMLRILEVFGDNIDQQNVLLSFIDLEFEKTSKSVRW